MAAGTFLQRWFSGIGSIAVTVLVVLPYPPIVHSAEPEIGSLTAVRGSVTLKRPGSENAAVTKEGLAFMVGDVIETGAGSTAQMTLTDDSFMNLGPGTAVRVNQYSFDPATDRRATSVRVIKGKTRFVIFKLRSPGSSFRVEAENALITPGGFADLVVLASPGRTEVAVLDQGLVVRNSLPYVIGDVRVGVNQRTIVHDKNPPVAPVVITPQERKQWLKDFK
jgi:ferric-dicitrate binding protein FerR (iron transport regulator)